MALTVRPFYFMGRCRRFISNVASIVIVSLLYSSIVWALPCPDRDTLAPQSELVQQIARLDLKASLLLSEVFGRLLSNRDRVGLELLLEWIRASDNLHETLTVQREGGKILILARGFNIEFSTIKLEGGSRLPNSDIWVRINYYSYEPFPSLNRKQETYIHRCQRTLEYLLNNKFVKLYGHEPASEVRYIDLDKVVGLGDKDKDRLVSELTVYLNSGNGRVLILLGNYFDMKGLYNAIAGKITDELKLRNIFALGRFTYAGDKGDPKRFIPPRNMLCYTPSYSEAMLMPLYQFVYRRALEHKYKDGKGVVKVPIVIEEFSPFFEKDARRIEDLEISSWKGVDVVVKREKIRERHYRNPVYIIREGGEIVGGIATSYMQIGGAYKKNIPPKYKALIASHNPSGDTIFDFSVFTDVNPEVRRKRYGDILALTTLEVAKLTGKREVIAASRCEGLSMLTMRARRIDFKRAISEIANILARIRVEKGIGEDYRFVIDEILPYILSLHPEEVPSKFDLETFIQEHLSEDPFLNAFHHRLGAEDVLVVPNSRTRDIRGLGAQVYTSYYNKLQGITADPRNREELARQIFGSYYGGLNEKAPVIKVESRYPYDFSIFKRRRNLRDLSQRGEPLDILIIGGGIIGAGIARDASLRGLKVGLVDKGDFASGTSSRSSKLIHGGLRYLGFIPKYLKLAFAEMEFKKYIRLIWHDSIRLVFEASRERRILLSIAPHLVRPLRFLIPVYKRGLLKVFIGAWLYDLLSLFRNTRIHRTLFSARAVTNIEGSVNREDLKGGSLYYDAGTNDSRLVLENILSANEKGALITNYTEVSAITYDGNGRVNGAIVEDKLTGQKYTIKARKVINAAGPWIDSVRKLDRLAAGEINDLRLIGGSHIIVPRISDNAVVIFADDKRVIFVVPLDENRSLVGTTEREFDSEREDLDNPQPTGEEINYLLANVNRIFPNARLTKDRIIQASAGVRPLTESIEGMVDPNLVSRSHGVQESSRGLISVGGVKLTTYRSAADSVVTRILREIRPLDRSESTTDKIPLYGGEGVKSSPQEIAREYEIDWQIAEYLVNKYGSKYIKVLGLTRNHPELKERIISHRPYIVAEILYAVHFEMTVHLQDFVIRRTDIDLQEGITMDDIWNIARLLGMELGWTEEQISEEVKYYIKHSWRMRQKAKASFKGYIKRDIPGWAESDPSEIVPEPSRMVDIGIETAREKIDLDSRLGDFIYGYFPEIDTSEVVRVIRMCFNTRLELFNQDNILWEELKQRRVSKITLHSILESKTLFGNHSGDGIAWANIPAIRYLVSGIGDRQLASELLGILLGIGLSHEILGHEAGISSDGVLTFQDAMLTLEMVKAIKYNLPEYMNLLREIVTEDSPYIKQLKAIMTFTDLISPPIVWGGPEGIIPDMGLILKEPVGKKDGYTILCYNRESEGEIEEIGGFNVKWVSGIPYIQFNLKKAYSHLILSSGNVIGSIITAITERLGLDINRVQIMIEKPTVELIPVVKGEETVLVPVKPLGSVIEEPIDLVIRQGVAEHTVGGLGARQFYHWRTSNFALTMMENEVLPIGHMDGFFSSVLAILEKILNGRGPASAILQEIDAIVFVVYDLGEGTEFIFRLDDREDGSKRLVIAINKDSSVIIDPSRLMYAFLRFFVSGQKRVGISFKEVDSSPPEEKKPRPDYTIVRLNDNIKLELGSNGEIGRVWADGKEVSSFLVERSIPRLRSILASLPRNVSIPSQLDYDVKPEYRYISKGIYNSFKHILNTVHLEVLEHADLGKKILNYNRHSWDGLEAIFNFSDSIKEIDALRKWLLGLDSIMFDLDEKGEHIDIVLREKALVIKIPAGLKDSVNNIYLIACMLYWFYQNVMGKHDIEFDDIHQAISREISGHKEARAQVMTIDIGSGLRVYIDNKGWIGVKYANADIPLVIIERLIPGFRQYILGLAKVKAFIGPSAGFKFKGVPIVEEEAGEIIRNSSVIEFMEEGILDDVEKFLQGMPDIALPPQLGGIIYAELLHLMYKADELIRYISEKVETHGGFGGKLVKLAKAVIRSDGERERKKIERDVAMHEKLKVDIDLAAPGGFPPMIDMDRISAAGVLEQFRAMRKGKAFRIFTPRKKEDLGYFLRSPDQHTAAILLRAKERAAFTEGECYILGPVWQYLSSVENGKRLKMALVLHEVVEEFLYRKNIHQLTAHYIAEMFERFVLGEPVNLGGDSTLDKTLRGYFETTKEERRDEAPPAIRPKWIIQWLGQTLTEFAETVPQDVLEKARERCSPPYYTGVIGLAKRLRNNTVREALGTSEEEALFLERLLLAAFIYPQADKVDLGRYIGGFPRDKYDFPALLNLYIASRLRPSVVYAAQNPVSTGNAGFMQVVHLQEIGEKEVIAVSLPDFKSDSGEFADVHMYFFIRKITDVVIEWVLKRSGKRLDRERLIGAIEDIVYQMRIKDLDILVKFFSDFENLENFNMTFSSTGDYLFTYNKATGGVEINLDALISVKNPEVMEILIAVGLFGHLFLGYSDDTIDILRVWQGTPSKDEKRDISASGILTRDDVENTMHLLGRYKITPSNFIYRLSQIAVPGEKYPEGVVGYSRSPIWRFLTKRFRRVEITEKAIPEIALAVRKNIYGPHGDIVLQLPIGTVVEGFYVRLAKAISEEILSLYLPAGIRVSFINHFAEGLTNVLMYSAITAGVTGGEGEWTIGWDIRDNQAAFSITYPVGQKRVIPRREMDIFRRYFGRVGIESGFDRFLQSANETITVIAKTDSYVRGRSSDIHCGMIGNGISPDEAADSELIPVSEEELEIAIVSLELRLRLDKRSGKTEHADKFEKIINAIKLLAERKRIFKFSAKVRGPEEFLLGFADKRGIALCNEFFEGGTGLNTVLDEALFHEVYHLWAIQKRIDPGFAHEAARRLQEIFFKDYIHYTPGTGEPAKRSNLRRYARELINKKSRRGTMIGIVPPAASPGDRHGPDRKKTIVWDKTPEEQIVLDESGEEGLFFIKSGYKTISDKTEILGCVKVLTLDRVAHLIFYLLPQYAEALTEDIVFKKIIGAFINSYGISPAHLGIHTNYYKKGVEGITISWREMEYQVTVKRLREDWERHLSGKLPGMRRERVVQTPPPMPEVVTTIHIQPDSPAHNRFSIIPEYSEEVEDIPFIRTLKGIIDKPYNMVRLNLSGAIVDLVVPSEYADQAIALRLCRSLAVAVDAILNLPDVGGINILKERIVENLSEIRLEIDRSRLDVGMERYPYSVGGSALVFNLPFLDISDMDANAFFFSLLYFFSDKNRRLLNFKEQLLWNPPLNESDVDPGFYRLYWRAKGVMADRKKAPGEWIKVRIPPPHGRSFMRWWDVFIHKTGVVKVKLGDKDIPLFLMEKALPGFRRAILSLPKVSGWIKEIRMFQASIREGVPGWSNEDTADSLGVEINIWDEGIIKEYFPMVDAKMVIEIVRSAFSKRMAQVNRGDLGPFSFHFIRESNSLFGNHKRDGLAWANLGAIQYMIEKIEDERVKTITLGIILGVGISHEILGHELGEDDDELLTEQDELLTRNLAGEYNLNLADYLKFLGYIITEESPYYEQLESYLLTLIVGDIYYKLSKRGDLAVINNLGLLGALTGAGGIFKFSDRFSSWGEAYVYFNNRKKELLRLIVSYYIMFADDISSGAAEISDRDLVRALADKFKACFKLELGREEDQFLVNYMERMWLNRDRKAEGAAPENLLSKEEIEERIIQRFKTDKTPGLLYFDLDKILEEDSGTAAGYMDLLERIAGIVNYAVVIVNSNPERSIEQILREAQNPRLTRIIRQNITIYEKTNNGEYLLNRAIEEAKRKLKVDSIPEENITMAIYVSNRWKYPEELLRRFSVIIMTASLSKIDEEDLKRLERYFPDIGRLVRENRELLLREELREMNSELESQHQADMGISTQA